MKYDVKSAKILFNDDGKSKGAAYVQMNSSDDAMKVVSDCQKSRMNLDGNRLFVQLSRE